MARQGCFHSRNLLSPAVPNNPLGRALTKASERPAKTQIDPPALIGDVTSGASLFGFVGSICGPLAFAVIANRTGSFDWPFLMVAGQLAVSGAFALWYLRRRPA